MRNKNKEQCNVNIFVFWIHQCVWTSKEYFDFMIVINFFDIRVFQNEDYVTFEYMLLVLGLDQILEHKT